MLWASWASSDTKSYNLVITLCWLLDNEGSMLLLAACSP